MPLINYHMVNPADETPEVAAWLAHISEQVSAEVERQWLHLMLYGYCIWGKSDE